MLRDESRGAELFADASYVGWYRELFERVRAGEPANLLFDSSILEPQSRLYVDARRALTENDGARISSTFGWGSPVLISSIARRYGVDEKSILTTTGCTQALWHVYSAFLSPGAHVVLESPHFDLLPRLAKNRGATLSLLTREPKTFAIDPEKLESLLRPETRLVVLTNLHNPTGAFLDDPALLEIAKVANRHGVTVVVDEVYGDFVPHSRRKGPAALVDPCFISVNSLTKVYGLHALKCGWIIADESKLSVLRPVYSELEWGSSKITHAIASLVLDEIGPYESYWKNALDLNRPVLLATSASLRSEGLIEGEVPEHGCMYFPKIVDASDSRRFAEWMWVTERLVLAPGEFFGAPGHVRIGFGQPHEVFAAGLAQFASGLRQYRALRRRDA